MVKSNGLRKPKQKYVECTNVGQFLTFVKASSYGLKAKKIDQIFVLVPVVKDK
jgi:hypothetical protein